MIPMPRRGLRRVFYEQNQNIDNRGIMPWRAVPKV